MSVSLRQLEYFVAVVDEGSFTTAAARLHVSQPGLSHQIQALERQLGGPLLERLPRGVRLTPAGRTALPHARASLAHAERATSAALAPPASTPAKCTWARCSAAKQRAAGAQIPERNSSSRELTFSGCSCWIQ
jgi:DNA-binding transcriptional LysR family regulator